HDGTEQKQNQEREHGGAARGEASTLAPRQRRQWPAILSVGQPADDDGEQGRQPPRQWIDKLHDGLLFLACRQSLEVGVDLLFVIGGCLVFNAGGEAILRGVRLKLLCEPGSGLLERQRGLSFEDVPLFEVLLEPFRPWR